MKGMTQGAKKSAAAFKKISKSMDKVGKTAGRVGREMRNKLTLPIVAGIGLSLKAFGDLEAGITDTINLLNKEDVPKFSKRIEEAAKSGVSFGFSIADSNKALFDSVSALGAGEQAFEVFAVAQKLAIGGSADLSVAVDGITSVVNAYGRELTDASEVANAFFSAQKAGKTTVALLSSNIGKVAPIAKLAGVGFKELLAATAQLTLGGLSTEEATTALGGALQAIIKPTKESAKILKKFNIPASASEIRMKGLRFTLEQLGKAAKKNPDLIAQMIPNIRALRAVGNITDETLQGFDQTLQNIADDIKNGTGLNEAYLRSLNTLNRVAARTFGEVKLLSGAFGKALLPEAKAVLKKINEITEGFKKLSPEMRRTIALLAVTVAALGPLAITAGLLVLTFKGLAIAAGIVGGAFTFLSGTTSVLFFTIGLLKTAALSLFALAPPFLMLAGIITAIALAKTFNEEIGQATISLLKFLGMRDPEAGAAKTTSKVAKLLIEQRKQREALQGPSVPGKDISIPFTTIDTADKIALLLRKQKKEREKLLFVGPTAPTIPSPVLPPPQIPSKSPESSANINVKFDNIPQGTQIDTQSKNMPGFTTEQLGQSTL
jgi:TP901 family phage tail tape measure protein